MSQQGALCLRYERDNMNKCMMQVLVIRFKNIGGDNSGAVLVNKTLMKVMIMLYGACTSGA